MFAFFSACEKESNYRFRDEVSEADSEDSEVSLNLDNYPVDGTLAFHENFQNWDRDGYINQQFNNCETDLMITSVIMYQPGVPVVCEYNGFSVSYTLMDYAVNPVCGNKAGSSTADSEVSLGYVALQSEIFYECGGHNSDAQFILSELPSISKVAFSVSYGGDTESVGGISLWKKADGDDSFVRVGDYQPADCLEGELFTVELNAENVQLKFTPAISELGTGVNDGEQSDRSVRLHDLYVWSMANSTRSESLHF